MYDVLYICSGESRWLAAPILGGLVRGRDSVINEWELRHLLYRLYQLFLESVPIASMYGIFPYIYHKHP